jgi:hypothetical protein
MCAIAHVVDRDGEKWCETQKDLCEALGLETLPIQGEYEAGAISPNCCLCPIDMKRVAEQANCDLSHDDVWDWVLTKK